MTYPHIGNCGVNAADQESSGSQVAGFILRAPCATPSNWRAEAGLEEWLGEQGVVGIAGIDTRALVRHIREKGAMRGAVISGDFDAGALQHRLDAEPPMQGRDLVAEVTCDRAYTWEAPTLQMPNEADLRPRPTRPGAPYRVVAYDFGVKHNILRLLVDHGCAVEVVPATTPASEVLARDPEGVFLSNGPGDPAAVGYAIDAVSNLLGKTPLFGICLGHQILSLAMGATTYKMKFGHRGGNQPVRDEATGRVQITSQNHGFAVDAESVRSARVSHVNLNDGTVEGLELPGEPVFSVQYHPEASPGPHDAEPLFERFASVLEGRR
jgi:carbamoyl-phosphate synthase small subunit